MLKYAHGNNKGTGSQLLVWLVAPQHSHDEGHVSLSICRQTTVGSDGEEHFFDTGYVTAHLKCAQVAHVLEVLAGQKEQILGGRGLFRRFANGSNFTLHVDRVSEPFEGFAVHVIGRKNGEERHGRIVLTQTEGESLRISISSAMGVAAFGANGVAQ